MDALTWATRRMLQALDAYWLHCEGLPPYKRGVRGSYSAEDWWNRYERFRREVERILMEAGAL